MSAESDQIQLDTPHLSLTVLPYGHHLTSLRINDADAPAKDLLVGFADTDVYHHSISRRAFLNPVVGRYANRLPSGETLLASGARLHLPGAEGVCLHGGESAFDTLPWAPVERSQSLLFPLDDPDHPVPPPPSDPNEPIAEASSLHRLYSPAGADGFPCSLVVEALVVVLAPEKPEGAPTTAEGQDGISLGKVKVVLRAKIREDGDEDIPKGTPVNCTVHWGFRLDDGRDENVLAHRLWLASDKLVALDQHALATGALEDIAAGAPLDFSSQGREGPHRTIGDRYPEGGIDRNFLLTASAAAPSLQPAPESAPPSQSSQWSPRLPTSPQAILTSPTSALSLRFTSNQASVQVYTASALDGRGPARKPAHGGPVAGPAREGTASERATSDGDGYGRDGIVFLEFQAPVGAAVHCAGDSDGDGVEASEMGRWMRERAEGFGVDLDTGASGRSWEADTLLRRGQVYENWTEVEVVRLEAGQ
ncbi:hypothetical protein JCM3770_006415 [Rhodotorula araucariae]